jgi:hypothetical protein
VWPEPESVLQGLVWYIRFIVRFLFQFLCTVEFVFRFRDVLIRPDADPAFSSMTFKILTNSVSDPYSFFTDPDSDPVDPDRGQYGSGSGSNPDPIRIQGFNDQKLKKNNS